MKRKQHLLRGLRDLGCVILDQNGLLTVFSKSGVMYLRSRMFYTKPWLYLHCYLHRELFENEDWKRAYSFIISNQQINNNMQTFTNSEVHSYMSTFYSSTYRCGNQDHYYNFRNRKTIGIPLDTEQAQYTELDLLELFSDKTEHAALVELDRLKIFISNHQNYIS